MNLDRLDVARLVEAPVTEDVTGARAQAGAEGAPRDRLAHGSGAALIPVGVPGRWSATRGRRLGSP